MSSGRDVMMDRWAEEYELDKQRKEKQLSFEFDYDTLRDRELNDYLEGVRERPQVDPFFDTIEEYEDSRDTTPYNREKYEWEESGD